VLNQSICDIILQHQMSSRLKKTGIPEHEHWLHIFCPAAVWLLARCRSVLSRAVESSSPVVT